MVDKASMTDAPGSKTAKCDKRVRHGHARVGKKTLPYTIWRGMIDRCTNKKNKRYVNYGGRGIKVCERWRVFINFFEDMGEPAAGLTIERIDNDKGYEPGNCRWATRAEQNRNMTTSHFISFNGETKCLADWGRKLGLKPFTINWRLRNGWSVDAAFTTPKRGTHHV